MNWINDLLYAPIRPTKGFDMEAKEFADKVSASGITLNEIEAAVRRLTRATELLADWKESTAPTAAQPAGQGRILHTAPWPTLDEINKLIERYWRERQEISDAWEELSERREPR